MSPRAAWQLEAMGFVDVYDYVDGKVDWMAHGSRTEGPGPHYALLGEVADRSAVLTCRLGDRVGDVKDELESASHDYCVVLNNRDIVLGRLREKDVKGEPDEPVERVMEPGPTTVRPTESAKGLLERMRKRNVPAVIVTTKRGRLLGVASRRALERLVSE